MSLYDKSEQALADLNEVIITVKDSKTKLNESADRMTDALGGFMLLNKPLYRIVNSNLDLDSKIDANSKDLKSEFHLLKSAHVEFLTNQTEQLDKNMDGLKRRLDESVGRFDGGLSELKNQIVENERKLSKLTKFLLFMVAINITLTGYILVVGSILV